MLFQNHLSTLITNLPCEKKAIGEETRETAAVEDTLKMAEGVIDSPLYSGLSKADLLVRS